MASFRGQEIFLMVSGDGPRYTKEVLGEISALFFSRLELWFHISETPPQVNILLMKISLF